MNNSIWAINGPGDYMEIPGISEIQVLSSTKKTDLVFKNISGIVFYPSMKMLEFTDSSGKRVFVHGSFILKE